MAAEFILRSLYDKGEAQLQPFLDALAEFRQEAPLGPDGDKLPLAEIEARAEAIEASMRQVRGVLYSLQCGYFADPYNPHNLLSMCGLGEMRIYGVIGAPGDGSDVDEIIRWTEQRMKRKGGWALLDELVKDKELSPAATKQLLDKLHAAQPVMQERLDFLGPYWESLTGKTLSEGDEIDMVEYFHERYAQLYGLLRMAIEKNESLTVSY